MVKREFAFYVVMNHKDEIEFGGTLEVDEIEMVEGGILRIAGKFGIIDLGISRSDLKKIIKKEVIKDEQE